MSMFRGSRLLVGGPTRIVGSRLLSAVGFPAAAFQPCLDGVSSSVQEIADCEAGAIHQDAVFAVLGRRTFQVAGQCTTFRRSIAASEDVQIEEILLCTIRTRHIVVASDDCH